MRSEQQMAIPYTAPFEYSGDTQSAIRNDSDKLSENAVVQLHLEMFQTPTHQKLKLNESYELLPKDVAPGHPDIQWVKSDSGDKFAKPYQVSFQIRPRDDRMMMTIKPATITRNGLIISHFPGLKESRVEHAILLIAAKETLSAREKDPMSPPVLCVHTSIYQIRKEIIMAIRTKNGTPPEQKMNIESCPYNKIQIKEALDVLQETKYQINSLNGKSEYNFSRISNYGRQDDRLFIELGSMLSDSISNGVWQVTNAVNLIASRSCYMVRLIKLLQFRFKHASMNKAYNPSASLLVEKLGYPKSMDLRQVRHKIKILLDECSLVSHFREERRIDGTKVTNSIFFIYPSKQFIADSIQNNAINKNLIHRKVERRL